MGRIKEIERKASGRRNDIVPIPSQYKSADKLVQKARATIGYSPYYQIAFSNPSFEVWFLLHFNNQTTPVENSEAAIKLLKKKGRLEQYEKNKEVYEHLNSKQ